MSDMPRENRVNFVGPFSSHDVVIDGWRVPLLKAHPYRDDDNRIMLVLDRRIAADVTTAEAERLVPFIADCIAVALGYGCHPNEESERPLPQAPLVRPVRVHTIIGANPEDTKA